MIAEVIANKTTFFINFFIMSYFTTGNNKSDLLFIYKHTYNNGDNNTVIAGCSYLIMVHCYKLGYIECLF